MNYKKLFLASLASFVFLIIVNALLFPVFFPDGPSVRYENLRSTQLFEYHLLALFITAFLMAYAYPLISKGKSPWREGLKVGVLMSFFASVPMNLHVYAMVNTPFIKELFPAVWLAATWGAAGIVVGLVYGKGAPPEKEGTKKTVSTTQS